MGTQQRALGLASESEEVMLGRALPEDEDAAL